MESDFVKEGRLPRASHPDPVDVHVGSRLRLRRNLVGMSQDQLGKATGLTFQQIQKYERGANRMGASRLYQLGRILDVPVSYFFEGMAPAQLAQGFGESGQAPLAEDLQADDEKLHRRETMELIRAYYRITDPKTRRSVIDIIKGLADKAA